MNNATGAKTLNLKWFGALTIRQLLGVVAAFALALILTLLGFGASCSCFGMVMIAVVLYMLPRLLNVDNLRLMTLVGALFAVTAILIGGLVTAPGIVDSRNGNPDDSGYFEDVNYSYSGADIIITATLNENIDTGKVYFKYGKVQGIGHGTINIVFNEKAEMTVAPISGSTTTWSVSGTVSLNSENLYMGYLTAVKDDDNAINGSDTYWSFLTGAFDGDVKPLTLYGCFISTLYVMIFFFMIMLLSTYMRKRMEKTRERMEKEGRLYPPGYGKCEQCGAVVLPGEVNCRKCGKYIDRPDSMKPDKKDFFECSDCGAEVPMDAKRCPKCGAEFDEEEFEVVHADGTVETTKESFVCPECGAVVPVTASFCTKCGAKHNK